MFPSKQLFNGVSIFHPLYEGRYAVRGQ